jgi:N-acetylneuraminic acid mutarotase
MKRMSLSSALALVCLLTALPQFAAGQSVLLSEDFNGSWETTSPPQGWTITFTGDTAANDWHRASGGTDPWRANGTPFAMIESTRTEVGSDSLITPSFDCSGLGSITLRCSTYMSGLIGFYTAQLVGSVDGGPFEHLVFNYNSTQMPPQLQQLPLPWAGGQSNVRLAWVFTGASNMLPYWAIDNVTVLGSPVSIDVACSEVIAPASVVDSATTLAPSVTVENRGVAPASFYVKIRIGLDYSDSLFVDALPAHESLAVEFGAWTAGARGVIGLTAFTALAGDQNPGNDSQRVNVRIRVFDAGVLGIPAPADSVDSGATVTPEVRLFNAGSDTASFTAHLWIDGSPDSSVVQDLAPGESTVARFSDWVASGLGAHVVRCSIALHSDYTPANDTLTRTFHVYPPEFRDAAAVSVLAPVGMVAESLPVVPAGVVTFSGPAASLVSVAMALRTSDSIVYVDSAVLTVEPGAVDTVAFQSWLATPVNNYTATLSIQTTGDDDSTNNSVTDSFSVGAAIDDVAAVSITSPAGRLYPGTVVPRAVVQNLGSRTESFWSRFSITAGAVLLYRDSARAVQLRPGDTVSLTFPPWAAYRGTFVARCSTRLPGDDVDTNNRCLTTFTVETLNFAPGWHEADSVPLLPGSKDVKGGGSLVTMAADGRIYALKGNKTFDFFVYDAPNDSWRALPLVPAGPANKAVEYGATLSSDGRRYLYATKGNNTRSFYRFDIVNNAWAELDSVPLGLSGKKVKGGASAAFFSESDGEYVYLLKGYRNEFYRYHVASDSWATLEPAPATASEKYDKGSFVVSDGVNTVYCHQAKYHKFYAFDIATQRWRTSHLDSMPILNGRGKSKKCKDGAAATWVDGFVYALKGGGTGEFWRYDAAQDSWKELDTIPSWGSTHKKKFVKSGGAIAAFGSDVLFILKGNKTHEFWRYRFAGTTAVSEPALPGLALDAPRIWPNPARSVATVIVPAPAPGEPALVRVYDARGALRLIQPAARGAVRLDCAPLNPGVYYVRVNGSRRSTQLVVQ